MLLGDTIMYKVLKNEKLNDSVYLLEIECLEIARESIPGQFVIVMAYEDSERIPLTIYDYDKKSGSIKLVYQVVGASTLELTKVKDNLYAVLGPLGNRALIIENEANLKESRVLFVAGGVGVAPVIPQMKYLKDKGISVDLIYGAKNKSSIILENEVKDIADDVIITTDDGSYGIKGFVTDALKDISKRYDYCVAIGPVVMMKHVVMELLSKDLKTIISMNPIMIDGSGMCGACRVMVDGKVKFACVDGPEFFGEEVDFDMAIRRMNLYKTEEGRAYLKSLEGEHKGCKGHE